MEQQGEYPLQDYAQRSVLATWRISFEQVKSQSKGEVSGSDIEVEQPKQSTRTAVTLLGGYAEQDTVRSSVGGSHSRAERPTLDKSDEAYPRSRIPIRVNRSKTVTSSIPALSQRRRSAKKSHRAADVIRTLRPETSEKESSTRVSQTTHKTVGNDTKPEVGRIKESSEHTATKGKVIE
jgi:hypothetical protein